MRERERGAKQTVSWSHIYNLQHERSLKERKRVGFGHSTAVQRALDSLQRHSGGDTLSKAYTNKLFQKKRHLCRCNEVLAKLQPLQCWLRPEESRIAPVFDSLQEQLCGIARPPRPLTAAASTPVVIIGAHSAPYTPQSSDPAAGVLSAAATPLSPCPPSGSTPPAAPPVPPSPISLVQPSPESSDALRAMIRVAVVRGHLCDSLRAIQALLSASGCGEGAKSNKPSVSLGMGAVGGDNRAGIGATTVGGGSVLATVSDGVCSLREYEAVCSRALSQRGLAVCSSTSLGVLMDHPMLGVHPSAELPARAALLAGGNIEASAAAAVLTACLAQAATSTVWGVGPWDHDYTSLIEDPPPDEIASAVALAYRSDQRPLLGIGEVEVPDLELRMPVCLDICPDTMDMLVATLLEVLTEVLALVEETSNGGGMHSARECALVYTSVGLLRLFKVHLHYVCTMRLQPSELHLDIEAGLAPTAEPGAALRPSRRPRQMRSRDHLPLAMVRRPLRPT